MTDTETYAVSRTRPERTGLAAALMLIFAVGQFVSPVFSMLFGGAFMTADRSGEPPIVPAGYTFSIWGVIELFSLGWAIWALWWRRRTPAVVDAELVDRLAVPLVVVYAGFSVWLVAAEVEPYWSTLAVFIVIVLALLKATSIALAGRSTIAAWPRLGRALFWGMIGLYLGWCGAAIWLNLTTGLAGSGAPIDGVAGVLGQLAILAGVAGTAIVILFWTGGLLSYAAAVCWALVGAILGALGAGQPGLALAAGIGLGLVVVTTVVLQVRRRRASFPGRTAGS